MTTEQLGKLYLLKSDLDNIKSDFKNNLLSKNRLGALVVTKLEEAQHWLSDLIDLVTEEKEGKGKKISPELMERIERCGRNLRKTKHEN